MKKTLVFGHRGAAGHAPENTLISFSKALEMGCDGIELDVHLSKDNEIIVCHDERVDRTTDGIGFIKDLSTKEIKSLDAGKWYRGDYHGQSIPTLEEVIELIGDKNIMINIELKSGPIIYKGIEERVVEFINKYGLKDRVIVSSFNHYSLYAIKQFDNGIKTGALYMAGLYNPWEYASIMKADAIHPYFFSVNADIVKGCIEKGIMVNPYTVNDEKYLSLMAQMGVSGIITDFPDIARKIVDQMQGV